MEFILRIVIILKWQILLKLKLKSEWELKNSSFGDVEGNDNWKFQTFLRQRKNVPCCLAFSPFPPQREKRKRNIEEIIITFQPKSEKEKREEPVHHMWNTFTICHNHFPKSFFFRIGREAVNIQVYEKMKRESEEKIRKSSYWTIVLNYESSDEEKLSIKYSNWILATGIFSLFFIFSRQRNFNTNRNFRPPKKAK